MTDYTTPETRIAIIDAFMRAFPEADSSEIQLPGFGIMQVDWLDPFRDSISPRTFDVVKTKTGYAFKEC